jgi:hypothetical protein
VRLRHPRLAFVTLGVTLLTLGLLLWRAPAIQEAWQHYSCEKREIPKAEREAEFVRASLGRDKVTRAHILKFLRTNYPAIPVSETKSEVHAGLMIFRINDNDEMIDLLQMSPCPVA